MDEFEPHFTIQLRYTHQSQHKYFNQKSTMNSRLKTLHFLNLNPLDRLSRHYISDMLERHSKSKALEKFLIYQLASVTIISVP